ncbi:succinate--hydroxymethylglutarate CoA-transferase [Asbolus verrucosus]|uniref:Succinate--hydroxymethylglutarate CoA-transferase n=1 Tax=Asbolus verrucosus TaxID=1661398 RepID=A0A482VMM5_ASBVE|nr:succinate--hydroxymethylglutarate CoA-transferase [Asbolus verrucosus]
MLSSTKKCFYHFNTARLKIARNISQSIHSQAGDNSPLEGVRVLDLTRIVAGPYCTMILSDLGAEIVYELAKKSDVLVENYVPGKLDELDLGYDQLKGIAPHLIYCSITGFGPDGPYSNKPGYDVIAASMGGFLHITGPQNGEPCKPGVAITDLTTGLYAHGAIMAALFKRMKTGRGQKIDCNLLSSQVATLINIGSNYLNTGKEAVRWGTAHESIVPYQAFPTKDGYFTIGTGSDLQYRRLCDLLNRPDLAENDKFKTNRLRVKHRVELIDILSAILATKTNLEWTRIFEGSPFPCGPVNSIEKTFNDPHIKKIGLVKELEHPIAGNIKVVGPPVKYSEGGNYVRTSPPTLGQHTDADQDVPTLKLRLKKPKNDKKVQWTTETVDNEHMNKKKSKCCCIYEKPRNFDESSSDEESDDECEHCKGHVEKRKKKKPPSTEDPGNSES